MTKKITFSSLLIWNLYTTETWIRGYFCLFLQPFPGSCQVPGRGFSAGNYGFIFLFQEGFVKCAPSHAGYSHRVEEVRSSLAALEGLESKKIKLSWLLERKEATVLQLQHLPCAQHTPGIASVCIQAQCAAPELSFLSYVPAKSLCLVFVTLWDTSGTVCASGQGLGKSKSSFSGAFNPLLCASPGILECLVVFLKLSWFQLKRGDTGFWGKRETFTFSLWAL